MKYKKVQIEWNDAYHPTASWLSVNEIADIYKSEVFKVTNIGWLLFEDKRYVVLASKRSDNWGDFGAVIMIPKGMIVKRKLLK